MLRSLALVAGLTLTAAAQPPARKLAAPKIVEEGGKKVAVFEYGKTDPAVKIGELTLRILPLRSLKTTAAPSPIALLGYQVENRSNQSVQLAGTQLPNWFLAKSIKDSTGREMTVAAEGATWVAEDRTLAPDTFWQFQMDSKPHYNPKADSLSMIVPAPPGSEAELWRVVFPRKTWVQSWPVPGSKVSPH